MPNTFFPCTRSTIESLTSIFDFLWPTAAALWNLRWQVQGFLEVLPDIDDKTLEGRFVAGSEIHGANLRRACVSQTWEQQKENLAQVLITSVFALYESWCEQILELLHCATSKTVKGLQFPTGRDANRSIVSGVKEVLNRLSQSESLMMTQVIYPALVRHPRYSLKHLDDYLTCYRYFKEMRNCLMHRGGMADQKCVDAYAAFAALPTAAALGLKELPHHAIALLDHRVSLSLRGVVGLSDIVLRIVITLDAELSRHHRAETLFVDKWKSMNMKDVTLPADPRRRSIRLRRLVKKLGWQASVQTQELELILKKQRLCH